ncbi:HAD family hydrolase [Serinicoccus marinus]|uniref:HAD family hydrolase n=1 Tax=Serinicoccus marinus TaxID=247333 RepID=UPI0003B410F5|nr:HAD family hydrolase [Serinicoccus marinus]
MTQIRAVIFDLDGTLVDHVGSATKALEGWLPELGATLTAELRGAWLVAEEKHFPAWRAREVTFAEQRRRRLRDFLPLIDSPVGLDAELDDVFAGYLRHYEAAWTCFDDARETLQKISRLPIKTAVLTNGTDEQQHAKIKKVGLAGLVSQVFTAESLGAAKPDLSTYRSVCKALNVEVNRALHVGDVYALDVTAPREAGLQAVHLDRDDAGPFDEPTRIRSLRELLEFLRSREQ